MNNFLSWWNYSQLRFNWTKNTIYIYILYIYIYIYIYIKEREAFLFFACQKDNIDGSLQFKLNIFIMYVSDVCAHTFGRVEASSASSHTEELWYNETVCLWMTISTLPSRGLSNLAKELTAATRVMQSSSNELSTLVSDSAKKVNNER